ncbi:MAG: PH domain-containing protein [Thermoplasmatota archaeon]
MKGRKFMGPLLEVTSHGKYQGTFPRRVVRQDEDLILEWKPSRIMMAKGGPLLLLLAFPGSFTIPFLILIPLFAFFGVLNWVLDHSIQLSVTVFGVLVLAVYLFGRISWMRTSYAVTDRAVYVQTGMIFNRVYRTPLEEIEGVKVERGPLEKLVNRGTLVFFIERGKIIKHPKVKWHFIRYPERLRDSFRMLIDAGSAVDIREGDVL